VYRTYAYSRAQANSPESMVGPYRTDFVAQGMYDIDKDVLNLKEAGRIKAEEIANSSKYPYKPSQSAITSEIERAVKEAGFTGASSKSANQSQFFHPLDLVDIPERGDLAKYGITSKPRGIVTKTRRDKGYTVDPMTGQSPLEGLMVGYHPDKTEVVRGPVTSAQVNDFLLRNRSTLKGEEKYFGTWVDDAGNTHMDISKRYPAGDVRKAMKAGEGKDQLALWDVGKGEEIKAEMKWEDFIKTNEFHDRMDLGYREGKEYMKQHPTAKWWDTHGTEVEEVYGLEEIPYWAGYTSATSQGNPLGRNTAQATEYMRRRIKGEPTIQPDWRTRGDELLYKGPGRQIGMEKSRIDNLRHVEAGNFDKLQRDKVNEMFRAQMGDPGAGPLDRYYARASEKPASHIYPAQEEAIEEW